ERAAERLFVFVDHGLEMFGELREDVLLLRSPWQVHPDSVDVLLEKRHQAAFRRMRLSARLIPVHSSRSASSMALPSRVSRYERLRRLFSSRPSLVSSRWLSRRRSRGYSVLSSMSMPMSASDLRSVYPYCSSRSCASVATISTPLRSSIRRFSNSSSCEGS